MAQIKLGYTYWQQPDIETMPAVSDVRAREGASMGVAIEGSEVAWPSYDAPPATLPAIDTLRRNTRWIEVFNRGKQPFSYTVAAAQPWVVVTPATGVVTEMSRVEVSADWPAVPAGEHTVALTITGGGEKVTVRVPVNNFAVVPAAGFAGFVEADRHVAIEAPHFSRAIGDAEVRWQVLGDFGRTLGGVTPFPVLAAARQPGGDSPRLEYDVHLTSSGDVTVELHCAPSLDFQSGDGLRVAVSFDDAPPQVLKLNTLATLQTWEKAVGDGVRIVSSKHRLEHAGSHVFKFWMVTPGVVLERVIINAGGVKPSYLGPPESLRIGPAAQTSSSR